MTWEEFLAQIHKYKDGATVAGEMQMPGMALEGTLKVDDIPVSKAVDYEKLTEGDDKPHEVVVAMPVGKSKRGWTYTEQAVKSIVRQVNESTTAGFKGHQKAEDVSTEFLDPATHWIGAKYDEASKKAFFRGYIDPNEKNLRRWIQSGRIKETSIFGQMHLKKVAGETHVTDCDLMSIDWTPLGRPGMKTQIVDMKIAGEMIDGGGTDLDKEALLKAIREFMATNKITARELAGEMDTAFLAEVVSMEQELPRIREELGLKEDATFEDVQTRLKELAKLEEDAAAAKADDLIKEVIKEKLPDSETAQSLAGEMFTFTGETKEAIAGEMDAFLAKPAVKNLFDGMMTDSITDSKKNNRSNAAPSGLRTVRRSLN